MDSFRDFFNVRKGWLVLMLLIALVFVGVLIVGCQQEEAVARGRQTKVYMTNGGDKQVVASGGEIEILSGGTLDVQSGAVASIDDLLVFELTLNGDLVVTGTADFQGNVANSLGDLVLDDDVSITGTLDAQGAIFNSGGTLTLGDNIAVTGTVDFQGNISSSSGAVTIADNVLIDGAGNVIQLTVQGHSTQTSNIFVVESSDGTDRLTVDNAGNLMVAGAAELRSTLDVVGNVVVTGTAELGGAVQMGDNLDVTGNVVVTGTVELGSTLDVVGNAMITGTLDVQGTVFDSGGDLTLGDNIVVTGTADLQDTISNSLGDLVIGDNVEITGTLDVQGSVFNSGGTLTLGDNVDITGTLQYGANNLYPIGFSSSGYQMVASSTVITGNGAIVHGLSTPLYGVCTLAGQMVDNAEQKCSVDIAGATVTIYVYKEDGTAGDTGVPIYWILVGTP